MLRIKKKSAWSYETSAGGEVSISLTATIMAGTGFIYLKSPDTIPNTFQYASAGGGVGGAKEGLISKGGFSISQKDFFSTGSLYILEGFKGDELRAEDLTGGTAYLEVSAAFITEGAAVYAMLLGIDPLKMQDELMSDAVQFLTKFGSVSETRIAEAGAESIGLLKNTAKAVLFMGGRSRGIGFGAAAVGAMGYVWQGSTPNFPVMDLTATENVSPPKTTLVTNITIPISLPDNVLFDTGKFVIKQAGENALTKAGATIRLYPNRRVLITGYTDNTGGNNYNIMLSENRAKAVKQWLVTSGIVKDSNVTVSGYGKDYPIASNITKEGRKKTGVWKYLLCRINQKFNCRTISKKDSQTRDRL